MRVGLDASVKDKSRYPDGWAYFIFRQRRRGNGEGLSGLTLPLVPFAHGEKDSVFVQFYPI